MYGELRLLRLNISFVVYCQHPSSLSRIYEIMLAYSPFFSQTLILLNIPKETILPAMIAPDLRRTCVLRMPDKIDPGAALNKIFPHLTNERVFLVDSRAILKKEMLVSLRKTVMWEIDSSTALISFQSTLRYAKFHPTGRLGNTWKDQFCFASTLSWGALLFHYPFVLELGAFQHQLSDDALMVDLSWRAQKSRGLMLQSEIPLAILKDRYLPSREEWLYLKAQYPDRYPDWIHFIKRSYHWMITNSHSSSQNNDSPIEVSLN